MYQNTLDRSRLAGSEREDSLEEVRLEVNLEQVSSQPCHHQIGPIPVSAKHPTPASSRRPRKLTLDRVVERQDMNPLSVLDIVTSVNVGQVSQLDPQVVSGD